MAPLVLSVIVTLHGAEHEVGENTGVAVVGVLLKVATKVDVDVMVKEQLPVPEQLDADPVPVQPVKLDPPDGEALQITPVPLDRVLVPDTQFVPLTVPDPVPEMLTVKLYEVPPVKGWG